MGKKRKNGLFDLPVVDLTKGHGKTYVFRLRRGKLGLFWEKTNG